MKRILMAASALGLLIGANLSQAHAGNEVIVEQYGYRNGAAASQHGKRNKAFLYQTGRRNMARAVQEGPAGTSS